MNVSREQYLYHSDFSPEVQSQDTRTWGVQLVIVKDGLLFVQDDVDAADRVEAHDLAGRIVFPEMKRRINGAGGGKKKGESLQDCAFREMWAELGIKGEGELVVLEELPIIACGQIREVDGQQKGALLGVVLAAYEPTNEEWANLRKIGRMVSIETVIGQAENDTELRMRPTFRQALRIGGLWNEGYTEEIAALVGGYNQMIIEAMRDKCTDGTIDLKQGIFFGINL